MNGPSVHTIEALAALAPASWGERAVRFPLRPGGGWIAGAEFWEDHAPAHLAAVVAQVTAELAERIGCGWALEPAPAGYLRLVVWGDK